MKSPKAFTLIELLAVLAIIAILGSLLFGLVGGCAGGFGKHYSEGSRAGIVTKFSRKGLIYKSWEGELVMGGFRNTTNSNGDSSISANVLEFNADPDVVDKVQAAMNSGRRVELVYRQWWKKPVSIDNDHVVIDVKPADGQTAQ